MDKRYYLRARIWGMTSLEIDKMREDTSIKIICAVQQVADRLKKTYPDIADRIFTIESYTNAFPDKSEILVRHADQIVIDEPDGK